MIKTLRQLNKANREIGDQYVEDMKDITNIKKRIDRMKKYLEDCYAVAKQYDDYTKETENGNVHRA